MVPRWLLKPTQPSLLESLLEPALLIPWAHSNYVGSRGLLLQSQNAAGTLPGDWGVVGRRAWSRRCATEQTWKLRAMPESLCFQASTFIQDSQGSGNFNLKMGFQVITKVFFFFPRWDDGTLLYLIICYLDLSLLNMCRHDNWLSIYKERSWQNQGVGIASDLKLFCFCFCFFAVLFSLFLHL